MGQRPSKNIIGEAVAPYNHLLHKKPPLNYVHRVYSSFAIYFASRRIIPLYPQYLHLDSTPWPNPERYLKYSLIEQLTFKK